MSYNSQGVVMVSRRTSVASFLIAVLIVWCFLVPTTHAQSTSLYFPATGHHLTDNAGFVSFWQVHNGAQLLGFPITEQLFVDGLAIQYFEYGRLEQYIDAETGATDIQTGAVGVEYAEAMQRIFAPPPRPTKTTAHVADNGYMVRVPFLSFWEKAGGLAFFGQPISEAIWETTEHGQRRVQYFERGRLEYVPEMAGTADEIAFGSLGKTLALLRGIDIAPVANWGATVYGPPASSAPDIASLDATPTPTPVPPTPVSTAEPTVAPAPTNLVVQPTAAPASAHPTVAPVAATNTSNKLIAINLSQQWLYAYEGDTMVFDAPVATGRDGMNTPTGNYTIYSKIKSQTMRGTDNGVPWVVPDVPDVMYFNGGVALHGTYWHNLFGTGVRPSHGCVNLPLDSAAWLYDWAGIGVPVSVSY